MKEKEILEIIEREIKEKTFGVVEQFLGSNNFSYKDGILKIFKIEYTAKENDDISVYLHIENAKFLALFVIDTKEKKVLSFDTKDYFYIYFKAATKWQPVNSEDLIRPKEEIRFKTNLEIKESWQMGDKSKSGMLLKNAGIFFKEIHGTGNFEDSIKEYLTYLETDKENIKQMGDEYETCLSVPIWRFNGTNMIGGVPLDKEIIKRLADLNCGIDFDIYLEGKLFLP